MDDDGSVVEGRCKAHWSADARIEGRHHQRDLLGGRAGTHEDQESCRGNCSLEKYDADTKVMSHRDWCSDVGNGCSAAWLGRHRERGRQ